MSKQCKCEHWQICPICRPNRFDSNGNLLPPEPTPLQAARQEAESLRDQLREQVTMLRDALTRIRDRPLVNDVVHKIASEALAVTGPKE